MAYRRRDKTPNPFLIEQARKKAQLDFEQQLLFSDQGTANQVREEANPIPEALAQFVPVLGIKLVRLDSVANRDPEGRIRSPRSISQLLAPLYRGADREMLSAVLLTTKNTVIGVSVVSVGDLSSSIVHPREVLKPAILANAASIIIAHNHPSGDTIPSSEDIAVTKRLAEACENMGIELLDHVILGDEGFFRSMKEGGYF